MAIRWNCKLFPFRRQSPGRLPGLSAGAGKIHILFTPHFRGTDIIAPKRKSEVTDVKDPQKKRFLMMTLSLFCAISLSIVVFFVVYRFQGIGDQLHVLGNILAPFVYGSVIAYLLRPMCNFYEQTLASTLPKKVKKAAPALSVALSLLSGILIVYMLIIMMAPQLYESFMTLWNSIPEKINTFVRWATERFGDEKNVTQILELLNTNSESLYNQLETWGQNMLSTYLGDLNSLLTGGISGLGNLVTGVGNSLVKVFRFLYNLLIGLIVACYLLSSRKRFARQGVLMVRSLLKPRWADILLGEIAFIDRMFGGFIDGKILDSAIIGLLCYIGCSIFRFPNALLVSTFVGVTNVIPFFGPIIGAVPSTFLIMIENPVKGLWFIVFVLALQQLDGNVIGPKILGDRTGLSSFWVLFAIVLCGGLWGVPGMIVCVPMFAVLYDIVKKLVRRGLNKKGQGALWEQYHAEYPEEGSK